MPPRLIPVRDVVVGEAGRQAASGPQKGWFADQVAKFGGPADQDLVLEVECRDDDGTPTVDDATHGAMVIALRERDPESNVRCFFPD